LLSAPVLALAACASVNPGPSFQEVRKTVSDRTGGAPSWARSAPEAEAVDGAVTELLKEDLTPQTAVRVALLNNPSLQASFEGIGVSQADLVQAGLVANPGFDGLARGAKGLPGTNVELALVQDVFDVFMAPLRKKVAAAELEQAKLRVAHQALGLAADVKTAYFTLQARQQLVRRLRLILDLARTAAELAARQHEAGTIADLQLENQIALHRQSKVDVAVAEAAIRADRERLNRLLGVWGTKAAWRIGDDLPPIPDQEIALDGLERLAIVQRQDLGAARGAVDQVGRALALKKKTRFFPVGINVGIDTEKDLSGQRVTGPSLSLQLPIFDTGRASIARLEAEHRRAQRQLEALAVDARSEVREARDRMLAARDLAAYYGSVLLPQRVRILELTLQYYNAMFKGAYDLLQAKQAEVEAEKAFVEAWRDYWIARTDLERALGGALPRTQEERQP
jgi:cobalt-zinc-cadmium efflux system outer membrane protein